MDATDAIEHAVAALLEAAQSYKQRSKQLFSTHDAHRISRMARSISPYRTASLHSAHCAAAAAPLPHASAAHVHCERACEHWLCWAPRRRGSDPLRKSRMLCPMGAMHLPHVAALQPPAAAQSSLASLLQQPQRGDILPRLHTNVNHSKSLASHWLAALAGGQSARFSLCRRAPRAT